MHLRLELKEEQLGEAVRALHGIYRAIEDDEFDSADELSDGFASAIKSANDVLEWVGQAKAELARQGIAA